MMLTENNEISMTASAEKQQTARMQWIDVGKFVAISAVIINHTPNILYKDNRIAVASYFCVTLFVFLSGVTSFYSNERSRYNRILSRTLARIKPVIIPYAVATGIYLFVETRFFDVRTYISHVMNFDKSGPFYYVLFYIQLIVVSPLLYRLIVYICTRKHKTVFHILACIGLMGVSAVTIKYTHVLDVHGGGKHIFGGTYLFIFYIGMLLGCIKEKLCSLAGKNVLLLFLAGGGLCLCLWFRLMYSYREIIDSYAPFGQGLNPPSISIIVYSLLVALIIFCFVSRFENTNILKHIVRTAAYIGKYSLYIFLYHILVRDYILAPIGIEHIWIKRVTYIFGMMLLPVLFKWVYDTIYRRFSLKNILTIGENDK